MNKNIAKWDLHSKTIQIYISQVTPMASWLCCAPVEKFPVVLCRSRLYPILLLVTGVRQPEMSHGGVFTPQKSLKTTNWSSLHP